MNHLDSPEEGHSVDLRVSAHHVEGCHPAQVHCQAPVAQGDSGAAGTVGEEVEAEANEQDESRNKCQNSYVFICESCYIKKQGAPPTFYNKFGKLRRDAGKNPKG